MLYSGTLGVTTVSEEDVLTDIENSQIEREDKYLRDLVRKGADEASQGFKLARILTLKLRPVSVQSPREVN